MLNDKPQAAAVASAYCVYISCGITTVAAEGPLTNTGTPSGPSGQWYLQPALPYFYTAEHGVFGVDFTKSMWCYQQALWSAYDAKSRCYDYYKLSRARVTVSMWCCELAL